MSEMNKSRGRTSPLSHAASERLEPLRSIRLTHDGFADTIAARYGWSVGVASRRGMMVHRLLPESGAEQREMSVSLHVAVHLRNLQPILRLRMPPVQLFNPQQGSRYAVQPAGSLMLRLDRTAFRHVHAATGGEAKPLQLPSASTAQQSQQTSRDGLRREGHVAKSLFRLVNASRKPERGNKEHSNQPGNAEIRKERKEDSGAPKQHVRQTLHFHTRSLVNHNRTWHESIHVLRDAAAASVSGPPLPFGREEPVTAGHGSLFAVQAPQASQVLRAPNVRDGRATLVLSGSIVRQFVSGVNRIMHVLHTSPLPASSHASYILQTALHTAGRPVNALRTDLRLGISPANKLQAALHTASNLARFSGLQPGNNSANRLQPAPGPTSGATQQLGNVYLQRQSQSPVHREEPARAVRVSPMVERSAIRDSINQNQTPGLVQAMRQAGIWLVRYMQHMQSVSGHFPVPSGMQRQYAGKLLSPVKRARTAEGKSSSPSAVPMVMGMLRSPATLYARSNESPSGALPDGASISMLADKLSVGRSLQTALSRIVGWHERRAIIRDKEIVRHGALHLQERSGPPIRRLPPAVEPEQRLRDTARQPALLYALRLLEREQEKDRRMNEMVSMPKEARQLWQRVMQTRERFASVLLRQAATRKTIGRPTAARPGLMPMRIGQESVERTADSMPARSYAKAWKQAQSEPQANPTVHAAQARDSAMTMKPLQARHHTPMPRAAQVLHQYQPASRTQAHSGTSANERGIVSVTQRLDGRLLLRHASSLSAAAEGFAAAQSVRNENLALHHSAADLHRNSDVRNRSSGANSRLHAGVRLIPRSSPQSESDASAASPPRSVAAPRPIQAVRMDVAPGKVKQSQSEVTPVVQSLQKAVKSIEHELNQVKEQAVSPKMDMNQLVDRMYREFARRIRFEQQRRGI